MTNNYDELVGLISSSSGVPVDEIERRIEAKQAKLSGLISKEGAAQVIAAELGVNFDKQIIKISQIVPGMKKINLIGKIINLFPIREYNKNGKSGRIVSFTLADESSNIRTVLWDENHITFFADGKISQGDIVEISNSMLRNGELHLSGFSEIKLSDKPLKNFVTERPVVNKQIQEFNTNDSVSTRAFVVNIFEPKFFEICEECKKKVNELKECVTHGKVVPLRRALLNFVIDDGSDSIRTVMFSDQIEKIIPTKELEDPEMFSLRKKDLIGKELLISGQVRKNRIFNNNEFIVSDIGQIDIEGLISELEK